MKKVKRAWVSHQKNAVTGRETYTLNIWNNEEWHWEPQSRTNFVADADDPKGPKDYIHFSMLIDVIRLAREGYEVDI